MKRKTLFLISGLVLAALVAPMALAAGEGRSLFGGKRNPSSDPSKALTSETEIIANTPTYGTRQSNKSNNGGGAIYGCRSGAGGTAAGNEPCIRVNNLAAGYAFELQTAGVIGGAIAVAAGGDAAKPFVTNATGVATGLNADRVDSKSADDLVKDAVAAVGGARPFALVAANGGRGTTRGVSATGVTRQGPGDYGVVFDGDRGACAVNVNVVGTAAGVATANPTVAPDKRTTLVDVRTFDMAGAPSDRAFHIALTC